MTNVRVKDDRRFSVGAMMMLMADLDFIGRRGFDIRTSSAGCKSEPMTAEIINFRKAQKSRAKAGKQARAAENRTAFGRTKTQRQMEDREKSKLQRELDGKQVDPSAPADELGR